MKDNKPIAKARRGLSKSRILSHLQCAKRLYLETYHPKLAEDSAATQQTFATGHEVGELARRQVPNGLLIGQGTDLKTALNETREALEFEPKRPLFESTFEHHGVLVRADLLLPDRGGRRLVEVKSSTHVKPHYFEDCAIQAWVIESAGHKLKRIKLAHVDKTFVYAGDNQYGGLLHEEDITRDARAMTADVPKWIRSCHKTLAGPEPTIEMGDQCSKPYPCPFLEYCLGPQTKYPVSTLARGGKIVDQFLADGITDLRDVPLDRLKNPVHLRQVRAVKQRKAELDPSARDAFAGLPFPRFYIDFETINPAVPIWKGTRPYQQIPFQWSCHIEQQDGTAAHENFLDLTGEDPSRALAETLLAVLKRRGPILVYNKAFEGRVLDDLATRFPTLGERLQAVRARLVDLLPITRKHYYHPAMRGSWSIKAVLPTIGSGLDYANLGEVQDGGAAQAAYLESIADQTTAKRKQALKKALIEYCKLDTLGMVKLTRFLGGEGNRLFEGEHRK